MNPAPDPTKPTAAQDTTPINITHMICTKCKSRDLRWSGAALGEGETLVHCNACGHHVNTFTPAKWPTPNSAAPGQWQSLRAGDKVEVGKYEWRFKNHTEWHIGTSNDFLSEADLRVADYRPVIPPLDATLAPSGPDTRKEALQFGGATGGKFASVTPEEAGEWGRQAAQHLKDQDASPRAATAVETANVTWEYIGEELAVFWESPYGHGKEKIASFWWPFHPPEKTVEVEQMFESIANRLCTLKAQPADAGTEDGALLDIVELSLILREETFLLLENGYEVSFSEGCFWVDNNNSKADPTSYHTLRDAIRNARKGDT